MKWIIIFAIGFISCKKCAECTTTVTTATPGKPDKVVKTYQEICGTDLDEIENNVTVSTYINHNDTSTITHQTICR